MGRGRWLIDGFDLGTIATGISSRSAGWQTGGFRGSNQERSGVDGTRWTPHKPLAEAPLPLNGWAVGAMPDGTVPLNQARARICRDNLERAIGLFSDSSRLRDVVRIESAGFGVINRFTNPRSEAGVAGGTGYRQRLTNPRQATQGELEVRRNLFVDPNVVQRGSDVVGTNLYPDPNHKRYRTGTAPALAANHWAYTSYESAHGFSNGDDATGWRTASNTSASVVDYTPRTRWGVLALKVQASSNLAANASLGRRDDAAFPQGARLSFRCRMRRRLNTSGTQSVQARAVWFDSSGTQTGTSGWSPAQTIPAGQVWTDITLTPAVAGTSPGPRASVELRTVEGIPSGDGYLIDGLGMYDGGLLTTEASPAFDGDDTFSSWNSNAGASRSWIYGYVDPAWIVGASNSFYAWAVSTPGAVNRNAFGFVAYRAVAGSSQVFTRNVSGGTVGKAYTLRFQARALSGQTCTVELLTVNNGVATSRGTVTVTGTSASGFWDQSDGLTGLFSEYVGPTVTLAAGDAFQVRVTVPVQTTGDMVLQFGTLGITDGPREFSGSDGSSGLSVLTWAGTPYQSASLITRPSSPLVSTPHTLTPIGGLTGLQVEVGDPAAANMLRLPAVTVDATQRASGIAVLAQVRSINAWGANQAQPQVPVRWRLTFSNSGGTVSTLVGSTVSLPLGGSGAAGSLTPVYLGSPTVPAAATAWTAQLELVSPAVGQIVQAQQVLLSDHYVTPTAVWFDGRTRGVFTGAVDNSPSAIRSQSPVGFGVAGGSLAVQPSGVDAITVDGTAALPPIITVAAGSLPSGTYQVGAEVACSATARITVQAWNGTSVVGTSMLGAAVGNDLGVLDPMQTTLEAAGSFDTIRFTATAAAGAADTDPVSLRVGRSFVFSAAESHLVRLDGNRIANPTGAQGIIGWQSPDASPTTIVTTKVYGRALQTTAGQLVADRLFGVTPGQSVWVYASVSTDQPVQLKVAWLNAAGTVLSTSTVTSDLGDDRARTLRGTAVAPANAALGRLIVAQTQTTPTALQVRGAYVAPVANNRDFGPNVDPLAWLYFDGASGADSTGIAVQWDGTPDASTSSTLPRIPAGWQVTGILQLKQPVESPPGSTGQVVAFPGFANATAPSVSASGGLSGLTGGFEPEVVDLPDLPDQTLIGRTLPVPTPDVWVSGEVALVRASLSSVVTVRVVGCDDAAGTNPRVQFTQKMRALSEIVSWRDLGTGAAWAYVEVEYVETEPNPTFAVVADNLLLCSSANRLAADYPGYFDGSSSSAAWQGAADASSSINYAGARHALAEFPGGVQTSSMAGGTRAEWNTSGVIPAGCWEDLADSTMTADVTDPDADVPLTIFTGSSVRSSSAVIRVSLTLGTAPDGIVVMDKKSGSWIQVGHQLVDGEVIVVDCSTNKVTLVTAGGDPDDDDPVSLGSVTMRGGAARLALTPYDVDHPPILTLSSSEEFDGILHVEVTGRRKYAIA